MLNGTEISECMKFKVLCRFLKQLNLFDWEQETLDSYDNLIKESYFNNSYDDYEYVWFLGKNLPFFCDTSTERLSFFRNSMDELLSLNEKESFRNLDEINKLETIETFKRSNKFLIDYIRNIFEQSSNSFLSVKFNTNITLLKWKFEICLIVILTQPGRIIPETITCDENYSSYFNVKTIKQNLLAQTRADLSLEKNRSNFELWKQYGLLKWILNHKKLKESLPQTSRSKQLK